MIKILLNRILLTFVTLMLFSFCIFSETINYKEGTTIEADKNSPTGYTVTFIYKNALAKEVSIVSDAFYFYKEDTTFHVKYDPYVWNENLFRGNSSFYIEKMQKIDKEFWKISMPLPSGGTPYKYLVDGVYITDPVNPSIKEKYGLSIQTNIQDSMVYVPFDKTKQILDDSVELPRSDKNGKIKFTTYLDGNINRNIAIYTPYNYDVNRKEPYRVIYASHGANETLLAWLNTGSIANIMDNLIANNQLEPTVLVLMDQNGVVDPVKNQMENILPFIESNYNVSKDVKNRAYCGLSNGGSITAKIYLSNPNAFGYFGIWSSAQAGDMNVKGLLNLEKPTVMIGIAKQDIMDKDRVTPATKFLYNLKDLGIDYTFYTENGAHTYKYWSHMFTIFARDILWKEKQAIKYTVNYKAQKGGEIIGDSVQKVREHASTIFVIANPKQGYKFVEWSDGVKTSKRADVDIIRNLKITAKFKKN